MPFHFPFPVRGVSTAARQDTTWKRQIKEKALAPVSLPTANPLPSYWVPAPCDIYGDGTLPESVDVVIIGSGISGTMTAWNLLKSDKARSILMLEARDVCSGATGRNGGHTKGAVYFGYETPGENKEMLKIIALQEANIAALHTLARDLDVDVGQEECDTLDIFYNPTSWSNCQESIRKLTADTADAPGTVHTTYTPKEFPAARNCFKDIGEQKVEGIVQYKAGRMAGYKLVRKVLEKCVDQGLNIVTRCSVTGLEKRSDGRWSVKTVRGVVSAGQVVLATNGYTAAVHPVFHKAVFPVRGDVVALRAGSDVDKVVTNNSMSFIYTEQDFDYMVVQPKEDLNEYKARTFVLGGGLSHGTAGVLPSFANTDDSTVNTETQEYLANLLPQVFGSSWGSDDPAGRVQVGWSGVMGFTLDEAPMVGKVPGEMGLWATVGFQGHGMAMALKCAEALVGMIDGRDQNGEMEWFPDSWRITEARLNTDGFWRDFEEEG